MDINATLWGQMITFALFVWFTMKFVWPMLENTLKLRQQKIAEGLQAAERGHKELEVAQKSSIKHIREAREQANQILELARKQAMMIIEAAKVEANQEREKIAAFARTEIEQQLRVAEEVLHTEVIDLVTTAAEKLLHRTMNETDQKVLLEIQNDRQS